MKNNTNNNNNNSNDDKLISLYQMLKRRENTHCPNVDEQWIKFKKQHISTHKNLQKNILRMFSSAVIGATAIFILLFALDMINFDNSDKEPFIAMTHNNKLQNVVLQQNDELINLSNTDSISFIDSSGKSISDTKGKNKLNKHISKDQIQKLTTPRGMDFKVILPDGSVVILNAESSIEFPKTFIGNERRVKLKGEAFFKVTKNEESPFIVTTDRMDVRVLGTEFNLKNYLDETPHVSLIKGSVDVYSNKTNKTVRIVPGKDASCDENGEINVSDFDIFSSIQWIEGFFYFDNLQLKDVMLEIGRWYNLGIVFYNKKCMHHKIHFSALRNDDIKKIVYSLNQFNDINIKIESNQLVLY